MKSTTHIGEPQPTETRSPGIGTLNEKALHEDLKRWYSQPGDQFEVPLDGFVFDILRNETAIEIQTRNFKAMARKLRTLLPHRQVRLIYPIAAEKWITKAPQQDGDKPTRRKSPKHGRFESVFDELISIPTLLDDPNFSLELILIHEEEERHYDGNRNWRRKGWATHERRLLQVIDQRTLASTEDLLHFLPASLPDPFTTADLAAAIPIPQRLAQRMAYCLRLNNHITPTGKRRNAILYSRRYL